MSRAVSSACSARSEGVRVRRWWLVPLLGVRLQPPQRVAAVRGVHLPPVQCAARLHEGEDEHEVGARKLDLEEAAHVALALLLAARRGEVHQQRRRGARLAR